MTQLTGPVGVRNGVTQVSNFPIDQGKIINLIWNIDPALGGKKGSTAPSPGGPNQCAPEFATAIAAFQAFWVSRGDLRVADGVVDRNGATLRKLDDALARSVAPTPPTPTPNFTDLNVLRFQQTLPGTMVDLVIPAITPASVMPFVFTPQIKHMPLVESPAGGKVTEFLFKIEKNGVTFWVGACVPAGTTDFSRAYLFFHPDTISDTDDRRYPNFTGRWETVKARYVIPEGLQVAAVKQMPLIVPFMTFASRANTAATNLFADRGVETINDILTAIQISLGLTVPAASIQRLGVMSFSSGVDHLFRFAQKVGSSGIIREQIDLDGAFIIAKHKTAPILAGAVNWMVTQSPPPAAFTPGWLYLPVDAFRGVKSYRFDTHSQIGFMMMQTMMTLSIVV